MMGTFFVPNIINTIIYIGATLWDHARALSTSTQAPCPAAVRAELGIGALWTLWGKRSGQLPANFLWSASKFIGGALYIIQQLRSFLVNTLIIRVIRGNLALLLNYHRPFGVFRAACSGY